MQFTAKYGFREPVEFLSLEPEEWNVVEAVVSNCLANGATAEPNSLNRHLLDRTVTPGWRAGSLYMPIIDGLPSTEYVAFFRSISAYAQDETLERSKWNQLRHPIAAHKAKKQQQALGHTAFMMGWKFNSKMEEAQSVNDETRRFRDWLEEVKTTDKHWSEEPSS
ncbi:MAG TPA: hypothetical protein VG604_02525 [Candidatus Saccharimonadales bacterium]|nr:hypothetical protein [Candidatus Saccharimonadales bacterium]